MTVEGIKSLGTAEVAIRQLLLPGEWRTILELPATSDRAHSIDKLGLLQFPVVRRSDMKLLAGRKRVAAMVRLGRETVTAHMVECSDKACRMIELAENAERTHDSHQRTKDWDELQALLLVAEADAVDILAKAPQYDAIGVERTPRDLAFEIIARERGVKKRSVEYAYRKRLKEQDEAARREAEAKGLPPPPPRTRTNKKTVDPAMAELENPWGIPVDDAFLAKVALIRHYLGSASGQAKMAMAQFRAITSAMLPVPQMAVLRAIDLATTLRAAADALMPHCLCPYCKGLPVITPKCGGCAGMGYLRRELRDSVPKPLLSTLNPVVMWEGQMRPLSDFIDDQPAEPEKGDWEL